jgi:hypothetical protein
LARVRSPGTSRRSWPGCWPRQYASASPPRSRGQGRPASDSPAADDQTCPREDSPRPRAEYLSGVRSRARGECASVTRLRNPLLCQPSSWRRRSRENPQARPTRSRTPRPISALEFRCEGRLRDNLRVGEEWRDDMLLCAARNRALRPNLTSRLALLTSTQSSNQADRDQHSFLSPRQRNQPVRLIFLQLNAGAQAGKSGSRFA